MTINNFNGGLNTRVTPNLIPTNESVVCNNIDLEAATIRPLNGLLATSTTIPTDESSFIRYNGQWISNNLSTSYVEFNDSLYYTDSIGTVMKTSDGLTFMELGIDAPTTEPTTSTSFSIDFTLSNNTNTEDTSDLEVDSSYQYLVQYKTDAGHIDYEEITFTYTGEYGVLLTISTMDNMEYVKLYRNYGGRYKYIGETESSLTIKDLTLDISYAVSTTAYSQTLGTRNYVYTYYSSTSGFESAPSPASGDLDVMINNVELSDITPPTDVSVDAINIYRLGGTLTNYYLVDAIDITETTYTDIKSDLEVLQDSGTLLETSDFIKPPVGLKFLTEYNSALFGCIDSTLYFSNPGLVDNWTALNYIAFSEHITGLGATQNGLLVFSRNKTWIITGESLATYSKFLLHGSQGCITHNTISYVANNLLWLSLDGICVSTGGSIELLSWKKLGKLNIEPITSEVYENQYYLFHDSGTLVVDFREGVRFYTLDLIARGAYYNYTFDKLYILQPDNLGVYEYNEGSSLNYTYKTGFLVMDNITNQKIYKNIYVYCTGTNTLKVYLDSALMGTYVLSEGFNDIKVPQDKLRAYYSELEFSGTGEIIEVEFKTEGRQNGR